MFIHSRFQKLLTGVIVSILAATTFSTSAAQDSVPSSEYACLLFNPPNYATGYSVNVVTGEVIEQKQWTKQIDLPAQNWISPDNKVMLWIGDGKAGKRDTLNLSRTGSNSLPSSLIQSIDNVQGLNSFIWSSDSSRVIVTYPTTDALQVLTAISTKGKVTTKLLSTEQFSILSFSPNGDYFIVNVGDFYGVWDTDTFSAQSVSGVASPDITWSPSSHFVIPNQYYATSNVMLWNVKLGRGVSVDTGTTPLHRIFQWSPDERYIAIEEVNSGTRLNRQVIVAETNTGKILWKHTVFDDRTTRDRSFSAAINLPLQNIQWSKRTGELTFVTAGTSYASLRAFDPVSKSERILLDSSAVGFKFLVTLDSASRTHELSGVFAQSVTTDFNRSVAYYIDLNALTVTTIDERAATQLSVKVLKNDGVLIIERTYIDGSSGSPMSDTVLLDALGNYKVWEGIRNPFGVSTWLPESNSYIFSGAPKGVNNRWYLYHLNLTTGVMKEIASELYVWIDFDKVFTIISPLILRSPDGQSKRRLFAFQLKEKGEEVLIIDEDGNIAAKFRVSALNASEWYLLDRTRFPQMAEESVHTIHTAVILRGMSNPDGSQSGVALLELLRNENETIALEFRDFSEELNLLIETWSPDLQRLAYTYKDSDGWRIVVVDKDGRQVGKRVSVPFAPHLTPNEWSTCRYV